MPFIKELVIHGFKSFARETRIPMRNSLNCIVGPNGSGKSNVTDAICFVLGRRGSKSMRAKKLSNLIFAGTEKYKPATEASVEIVFDNTDKGFSLNEEEVKVKRILRKNGQGVYKINDEIKTLQEVLELLAQAGIDPNGFNIVLQGEIDSFVKMTPEERREVIEEVAGISIYEMRKKHSLQELEKTDNKLKETNAILRERNAYLKNLEEERKQALHFKKLQDDVKNYKASISYKQASEKQDKIEEINKQINAEQEKISKINTLIEKTNQEIAVLVDKINNITQNIQKSSGLEQEKINAEISDLRADLAGLTIKKQSYDSQIDDMKKRKQELETMVENGEKEIVEMSKSKGKSVKKELEIKKKQLEEMDEQRRKLYILKSNLSSMNSRVDEKQRQNQKLKTEYDYTFSKLQSMESEVVIKDSLDSHREKIVILKSKLDNARKDRELENKQKINDEKNIAVLEKDIENQIKIQSQVASLDICPLCKTKITQDHISHVVENAEKEKLSNQDNIAKLKDNIKSIEEKIVKINAAINQLEDEIKVRSQDVLRLELINEKKDTLRKLSEEIKMSDREFLEFMKKKEALEKDMVEIKTSETNYDSLRLEVQEMARHEEANVGMEVTLKQRDIERNKNIFKQIVRELEESSLALNELTKTIEDKQARLDEKTDQDTSLKERFKKTLEEKNAFQEKIHFYERDLMHKQNEKHLSEERTNNLKIERAQYLAQKEAIEQESKDLKEAKILRMTLEELRKKLDETLRIIQNIGTVNMKSLEVYDNIKQEYEKIQEKVDTIMREKEEILKVIEDIDKKKKKSFMQTLEQLNALFSRNFSQLSDKGIATLEPVDKENLFEAGVEMLIKVGKGKYFDTNSLSGGEKSLISLSLIFAIQEYKPYSFYIFDEIDAALDRRNSERLAALLKRYMNQGQYIIITHNDSLITESPVIYGVTMQDKISKVVSLEV
jgi:chromosome segregation protein